MTTMNQTELEQTEVQKPTTSAARALPVLADERGR